MNKKKSFNKILKDIKDVKIQGAKNVAKSALEAYLLIPTKSSVKKLLSLRPTESLLSNVLRKLIKEKKSEREILKHFDEVQEKINKNVFRMIRAGDVIFTHCHSTTVVKALIYAKKKRKKFEVYNTETRPLFQGRKTAGELRKAGIKVTMFVDSALGVALSKEQGTKKTDKVFFGADALLKKGIINKIGSETIANIAGDNKIPVYVLADSWKFSREKPKLEQRSWREVWKSSKKRINLEIKNPAFEFVPKKYISGIITEFGVQKYDDFLREVSNRKN
jgi:translation initiation factor 2B subunit (eIF-2B alpha/beta/delta family)